MRTAISENDRSVLETRIQNWLSLEERQLDLVDAIAKQLAISEDEAIDMLNTCANSRAALNMFGIEVYPNEVIVPVRADADQAFDLEAMERWVTRFLFGAAAACFVIGLLCWLL